MPALVCSAQNCIFNNAMYCGKGDIKVGGEEAKVCQDTCCTSFEERKRDSAKSSVGSPSTIIEVKCEAENCKYNDDCICRANHVDIAGAAACECGETECVTFDDAG